MPARNIYKHLPYYHSTYRRVAGVISGSRHTATEIPDNFRGRRYLLPENGIDPDRFAVSNGWTAPCDRFRFITVGRLVPYKGVDLLLEAMAGSRILRACDLRVVGDGPQRPHLETLAHRWDLDHNVSFSGWIDQHSLAGQLGRAQAFAFPSLREFGGGVVLEAMAAGLPAIVVDYGGPGELVTPQCGALVPLKPREQLVPLLRRAMEDLAGDHERCRRLGEFAGHRVREEFVWSVKAERIVDIYRQILEDKRCKVAA